MKKEKLIKTLDLIFGDRHIHISDDEFRKCQGKCLKCDSEEIEYGSTDVDGQELSYNYECKNCGHWGKEWYSMEYIETR